MPRKGIPFFSVLHVNNDDKALLFFCPCRHYTHTSVSDFTRRFACIPMSFRAGLDYVLFYFSGIPVCSWLFISGGANIQRLLLHLLFYDPMESIWSTPTLKSYVCVCMCVYIYQTVAGKCRTTMADRGTTIQIGIITGVVFCFSYRLHSCANIASRLVSMSSREAAEKAFSLLLFFSCPQHIYNTHRGCIFGPHCVLLLGNDFEKIKRSSSHRQLLVDSQPVFKQTIVSCFFLTWSLEKNYSEAGAPLTRSATRVIC